MEEDAPDLNDDEYDDGGDGQIPSGSAEVSSRSPMYEEEELSEPLIGGNKKKSSAQIY